jgi:hypothetical protein
MKYYIWLKKTSIFNWGLLFWLFIIPLYTQIIKTITTHHEQNKLPPNNPRTLRVPS